MLLLLNDETAFVPLAFAEPDTITGYVLNDEGRTERAVRWQDVAAFRGSYNFAEDGDFEVLCKNGRRLIPLQFGRPCDASTGDSGPADTIYGYRADIVETDIVGKRMIERITTADIEGIRGSYRFSPIITDIIS